MPQEYQLNELNELTKLLTQQQNEMNQLREKLAQQEAKIAGLEADAPHSPVQPSVRNSSLTSRRRMLKKLVVGTAAAAAVSTALNVAPQIASADYAGTAASPGALGGGSTTKYGIFAVPTGVTPPLGSAFILPTSVLGTSGLIGISDSLALSGNTEPVTSGVYGGSSDTGVFGIGANKGISGKTTDGTGVSGESTNGKGVYGKTTNGDGVLGESVSGNGVSGSSTGNGSKGVSGASTGQNGVGVYARAITVGSRGNGVDAMGDSYGGTFTGGVAPIRLVPGATPGAPTLNTHQIGELYVGSGGSLYICVAGGTPGSWARLGGGSTTYLAQPLRILGDPNTNYRNIFPAIPASTIKYFAIEGSFTNQPQPPFATFSDTIPNNASSVVGTLVAFGASGIGFITIFPADANLPAVATMTYAGGGAYTSSSFSTKLGPIPSGPDAGKLGIAINASAACQISLDIVSYSL